MIPRDFKQVELLTYTTTVDAYGQKRQSTPTSTNIDMLIKVYSESNTDNPKFNNNEYVGITPVSSITDANQIRYNSTTYDILQVIPSSRYTQVLMKTHK